MLWFKVIIEKALLWLFVIIGIFVGIVFIKRSAPIIGYLFIGIWSSIIVDYFEKVHSAIKRWLY